MIKGTTIKDGVIISEADFERAVAALQELEKPKPAKKFVPWAGQLVEMTDDVEWPKNPYIGIFKEMHCDRYLIEQGTTWTHCRPLSNPLILQFRPHDGSSKCPVDMNIPVQVKYNVGRVIRYSRAAYAGWSNVIGYIVEEGE